MTTILAIETSTDLASVALLHDHQIISRDLVGVQTHSFGLLPAVQEILSETSLSIGDVDAIAFGCGPGAFTGVRTACGVVQGLAFGLQIPVLPVVSLLSMAVFAGDETVNTELVCCLDARMNEVYWAHYRWDGQVWTVITPPCLGDFPQALTYAYGVKADLVLGHGLLVPNSVNQLNVIRAMPHARSVLNSAEKDFRSGLQVQASHAQPLYLRNKIALTTAERQLARGSE